MAQLISPHFYFRGKRVYIESKDELATRLQGASTDEADAVLIAWHYREQALAERQQYTVGLIDRIVHGKTPRQVYEDQFNAAEMEDPLA